ncbi:hypothetical protein MRX96_046329 [Rhipicephalus microplus]
MQHRIPLCAKGERSAVTMSGPSPVFLLILGITIAMINIASTSTWAIDPYGTCKSPGVRCGPPGFENSCNGTCNCQLVPRPGISEIQRTQFALVSLLLTPLCCPCFFHRRERVALAHLL